MSNYFASSLLIFSLIINLTTSNPILSCTQTPYPEVCNSMLSNYKSPNDPFTDTKTLSNFRATILGATLNNALHAQQSLLAMNPNSFDEKSKAAWNDCLELHEDTISHLNKCSTSTSYDDTQTWLSAALANQETCKNGFIELGSAFKFLASPFMATNISESISNSLAINKGTTVTKSSGGNRRLLADGFPKWVSVGDRKLLQSSSVKVDLVVANDGSGNYKTITDALSAVPKLRSGTSRFVIHVKAGVYNENVQISKSMKNIMMIGDGIDSTIVTGNKNVQDGSTTFASATFAVTGDGFIAKGMTFQNTAGAAKHQAVALRSGSDLSVFYQCSFKGYQDTLYVYSQRQFYRNCDIYGTVDFIFGDAVVVLQNCNIYVRKPLSNQKNTVTAQGRSDPNENTGISIHNSVITAASDLKPVQSSFQTFLGRPWKQYSRTVFMKSSLDGLIDPAGWLEWSGNFALNTLYYGEYLNTGAGAGTSKRVKWPGFHVITSSSEAGKFTVGSFLSGDSWIPATGVPYTSGL